METLLSLLDENGFNVIINTFMFFVLPLLLVSSHETSLVARCRRIYAHAHDYHINSISNNRQSSKRDVGRPVQDLDDEAVYYEVAGACPKGFVYNLRSLWRKKRRYVDLDASTSQVWSASTLPLLHRSRTFFDFKTGCPIRKTGKLTIQSDVYAFGVVLLELLTGRKALDLSQGPNDQNLVLQTTFKNVEHSVGTKKCSESIP
ncbi:hypothetical protein Syun_024279 [Stephania yunnanensis]|uniref:Serine-threonine/tyrosine-protein kinase catalytic domain-containing protein n=1 Tax=Stephania yunnanensis TaxID=152371 RepID=A0AAP0I452_9MAGN